MRITLTILCILIIVSSCQKTKPDTVIPPPTPSDTTKPDNIDTTSLPKSIMYYNYDAAGVNITDSVFFLWSYDNKGRVLTESITDYGFAIHTTLSYSYNADKNSSLYLTQRNGVLTNGDTLTYFLNSSGKPDSGIIKSFSITNINGVETPQYSTTFTYYYYNSAGQDTLERSRTVENSANDFIYKYRQTYKGADLDSGILYLGDTTVINDLKIFLHGNLVTETHYQNGAIYVTITYTYYDIPSGSSAGDTRLVQSIVQNYPASPVDNRTENYTYTFDQHNRVTTATITMNNILTQKVVYTYL